MSTDVDTTNAVRFGDFVVDEETGEILAGDLERLDYLVAERRAADEQVKSWTQRKTILGKAIERGMSARNIRSLPTEYGTARFGSNVRRVAKVTPTLLGQIQEAYGITDELIAAVLGQTVKELDAKRLAALWTELGLDEKALAKLIHEEGSAYLVIDAPRKTAPKLERVEVEA